MGIIFRNPSSSHKWERRFVSNVLNKSGTTDNRNDKSDWNISSCLLNTSSIQMSTVADEQHNTIKFITVKANIKIQIYLQYIFYYSFLKHTIF